MARRGTGLFRQKKRSGRAGFLTLFVLFSLALMLTLGLNHLSNRFPRLETRSLTVVDLPRSLEGFKILHLSDLNATWLGQGQENIKHALKDEGYDLLALSGDMVGREGDISPLLDLLALVPESVPKLMVAGDADPAPLLLSPKGSEEVKAGYIQRLEAAGLIFLEHPLALEIDGQRVWVCPQDSFLLDLASARFALGEQIKLLEAQQEAPLPQQEAQLHHARHQLENIEKSEAALLEMKEGELIISLSHQPPEPAQLKELSRLRREEGLLVPSLFLAGQFNNGQARLPILGPIFIPVQADGRGGFFPGDASFTGLSVTQGLPLHISPGLGVSTYYPLPIRLFNRPVLSLIRLTARMTQ